MRKHAENSGKHVENMRSAENQPNLGISERRILTTAARWALGNAEFQKMVDIGHWRTRNLETRACKLFESNAKLEMRFLGGESGPVGIRFFEYGFEKEICKVKKRVD